MIFVDDRAGSKELQPLLPNSELQRLDSGDVCIISKTGRLIGVERKTVGEIVTSMQGNKRFVGQLRKMQQMYDVSYVTIDGFHKIRVKDDTIEIQRRGREQFQWSAFIKHLHSLKVAYNFTTPEVIMWDLQETALYIRMLANWYMHEDKHRSHLGDYDGRTSLLWQPSLKRSIAGCLPGVELRLSQRVDKHFTTVEQMITASIEEWMKIDKIGKKKATAIYEAIRSE